MTTEYLVPIHHAPPAYLLVVWGVVCNGAVLGCDDPIQFGNRRLAIDAA